MPKSFPQSVRRQVCARLRAGEPERRADIHQALLSLACAVICLRKLILN